MDLIIGATQKARLTSLGADTTEVEVHFNPASLIYTIENSSKQSAGKPIGEQYIAQFSARLTMDLQFDTTDTGEDVQLTTGRMAMFMQSSASASRIPSGASPQAQPVVQFQWGSYTFVGIMESYNETIDFFSADGVPLRSLVNISLVRQDLVLNGDTASGTPINGSVVQTGNGASVTGVSTLGGDPTAARQLGADNGLESLRFTGGASLQVNSGIQLNAASRFASPGTPAGAGISAASSGSLQLSAGVGGGALFGSRASAGVPASAGAFAGLETGRATVSSTARLDPLRMVRATNSADVSTGVNASFGLGGAANVGSGFSTRVGTNFNFSDHLVFDSD
ncbi:MAG TPA: hypothetical protein VF713_13185 [Thermoanaerobaculia bacterium]